MRSVAVRPSAPLPDPARKTVDRIRIQHVATFGQHAAGVRRRNLPVCRCKPFRIASANGDPGAIGQKQPGGREPYSGAPAGDNGNAILQAQIHCRYLDLRRARLRFAEWDCDRPGRFFKAGPSQPRRCEIS